MVDYRVGSVLRAIQVPPVGGVSCGPCFDLAQREVPSPSQGRDGCMGGNWSRKPARGKTRGFESSPFRFPLGENPAGRGAPLLRA